MKRTVKDEKTQEIFYEEPWLQKLCTVQVWDSTLKKVALQRLPKVGWAGLEHRRFLTMLAYEMIPQSHYGVTNDTLHDMSWGGR